MADERIEQREPPASLVALREELALPQNMQVFDYAILGRNFEECLARVALMVGIAVDGYYDVPELCDVLVTALKKRSVLKVLSPNGFTDGDISDIDQRLIGIRRIEDKDTVRLENRDLILPKGVTRGSLERAVGDATKRLSHPERISDGKFLEVLKGDSGQVGQAAEVKTDKPTGTD